MLHNVSEAWRNKKELRAGIDGERQASGGNILEEEYPRVFFLPSPQIS